MNEMLKHINLQLFAEGETIPAETKEVDSKATDAKQEKPANPFDRLRNGIFGKKEPEKKEPEKKEPDVHPEPEESKEPETKEPEKKEPEAEDEEIVYLGKTIKVKDLPPEERRTYLQKGMNYDKVKERADTAAATLKRIAQVEGFDTVEAYLAELDKKEKARLAEQIEEAAGDPEKINAIVENHPVVRETREEKRKLEFERIRAELSQDTFFKELEPEFNKLIEANPDADPKLVYKIVRSDYLTPEKINELIAKEKESVEKKILADVHDKERRSTPKGGDADDGKGEVIQPTVLSQKLSSVFGIPASKIAQRSHEKMKRS